MNRNGPYRKNPSEERNASHAPGTLMLPLLSLLALAIALSLSSVGGCDESREVVEPPSPRSFTPLVDLGKSVSPSSQQEMALAERGLPEHFWISLEPRSGDRVETWTWMSRGEELTFHNGRLIRQREIEDRSGTYPPTSLKPVDFSTETDLEDLEAMLGKPYFNTTSELQGRQMLLLFYTGAVVTFTDGSFSSIDTMVYPFEKLPVDSPLP